MEFLHQLRMRCGGWLSSVFRRRPDARGDGPYELASSETVARIIYSTRHFSHSRMRPKSSAFDPSPYTQLSGIHVTGLPDAEIWQVAKNTARGARGRETIYARADIPVRDLINQKLRAIRDDDPFVRHTSIEGWPQMADLNERKERWKAICLALSESRDVSLVVPKTPIRTAERSV